MRFGIFNDWLRIYPIEYVIEKLEQVGNYDVWEKNLFSLMKTELGHPMTIVLLQRYSLKKIIKFIKKEIHKNNKRDRVSNFVYWLEKNNNR